MANSNPEKYRAYMREYMLARYHRRRLQAIEELGGKCAKCGSVEQLELDHIDALTKTMSLSRLHSASQTKWEAEIQLCQVLCHPCHLEKSNGIGGDISIKLKLRNGSMR
jgi:5-methylcytosine-specific restriction endonuclease McrA